jgi:endoribonuclease Dicer
MCYSVRRCAYYMHTLLNFQGIAYARFDLFPNHISYAQSRARTNQRNGHFIIMVEQGNDVHRRLIHGVARLDPPMQQWVHAVANSHSGVVPPQSLLEKTNAERVESDDEDPIEEFIQDPTTGGRIYLKDATGVVYKYIADGNAKGPTSKPLFEYESLPGRIYVCTVSLFQHSPLPKVTGPPAQTKGEARRQACYETCCKLFKMGYLEHGYFPRPSTMRSFLPDIYANFSGEPDYEARGSKPSKVHNPTAALSLDTNGRPIKGKTAGTRCYARKRPAFWKNTVMTGDTDQLFPTVIDINLADHTEEKYRTMCLLTRHPLPPIGPFKLFFSGFPAMVQLRRCAPISITEEQFSTLHKYTVRICRSISGKAVECDLERTPYFFAPMKSDWKCPEAPTTVGSARPDVRDGLSWDDIVAGSAHWVRPLKTKTKDALEVDLEDAIIQDRWIEFTRKYDAIRLRTDLNPLSKPVGEEVHIVAPSYDLMLT